MQQIPQQQKPEQVQQQPQVQQIQQQHKPQLQQQLLIHQQLQLVHHTPKAVQAQSHMQLAQQQQDHEQPRYAQLKSHTHVQQLEEREQQDLPPHDQPKPARLDVIHSELLESTTIDGKEGWNAFKSKFNRLTEVHHWTTLEKRDNLSFCLRGVISQIYFLMLKQK